MIPLKMDDRTIILLCKKNNRQGFDSLLGKYLLKESLSGQGIWGL